MNDELYQEFITESEESITQLNNSLLDLEANPEDTDAIDDIFRQAHTLKGNFGAMGFDNAATVAHAVEDLLDAVRNGEIEVTAERMDLVFEGMDEILDILHEIEANGESQRDPSDLVDSLRAAAVPEDEREESVPEDESAEQVPENETAAAEATSETGVGDEEATDREPTGEPSGSVAAADETGSVGSETESGNSETESNPDDEPTATTTQPSKHEALDRAAEALDADDPALADATHLYQARIELDAGNMKGVDGGLFVSGLPDDLSVVGAEPSLDDISEGDFEEDFVLFVADVSRSELTSTLEGIWKVKSVALTDVGAFLDEVRAEADATSSHENAEEGEADATPSHGDIGNGEADGTPSHDDAGDGEVDSASAAAAVDAVVEAYTSTDGDDDDDGADDAVNDDTVGDDTVGDAVDDHTVEEGILEAAPSDEAGVGASSDDTAGGEPSADAADESSETGEAATEPAKPGNVGDEGGVESGTEEAGDTSEVVGGADGSGDDEADGSGDDEADGSDDDETEEKTPSISEVKSVRVDVDQLDELHSLVEQLVTSRIKLRQATDTEDTEGKDTIDELDKISSNLQDTVMDMRLIPLKKVFDKFPRLVRDLAREEDKKVRFSVEGQDIELDRTILDEISDPLMHVLRNAVDHGIEPPEDREAAGKSRTGSVELRAEREHDTVVITVEDDGGGIDADAIREKAVEKDIYSREKVADLPDEEVYDLIFHPGFSTNDEITDVSGRGVGMDVVKTTVESLDGSVNVDSTLGEGTSISIRLPVTVAIIKVLFVRIGDREFGVPIKYIDEISRQQRIQRIDGAEVLVHEDHIFPLIRLRDALSLGIDAQEDGMIVRIRPTDRQVALRCDGVARQEEVVVTPLQGPLKGTEGLSGTAVVGDGNVVPILDINSLPITERGKQARRQWVPPEDETAEAEEAAD